MKTKLLKRLRKRFDWKFIVKGGKKVMCIYDKKYNWIEENYPFSFYEKEDLEYLLEKFDDEYLKNQYGKKRMKFKFNKL